MSLLDKIDLVRDLASATRGSGEEVGVIAGIRKFALEVGEKSEDARRVGVLSTRAVLRCIVDRQATVCFNDRDTNLSSNCEHFGPAPRRGAGGSPTVEVEGSLQQLHHHQERRRYDRRRTRAGSRRTARYQDTEAKVA